jgi:L-fuconolactonase
MTQDGSRPGFVDSHAHFWDTGRIGYPWLAAEPRISGRHGPEELRAEAGKEVPEAIVFVQAECDRASWLAEVEWVESLAAKELRIAAIVAHAPMDAGAATSAALDVLASRPLIRGIRHLIQGEPDPGFCLRPGFFAGVRQLGGRGLTFDICCTSGQLSAVLELVRGCPGTSFILDHAGKPRIGRRELDPWRGDIARIAAEPNVVCKLSGLATEAGPGAWHVDDLRPYVSHLLATFGPGRLLFGSDWPVVKLASGYAPWLEGARKLVSHLDHGSIRAIFSDNARRTYRIG